MEFATGAIMIGIILGLAIFLIPMIFFLLTQQNTLKAIHPSNRTMNPGEVWLQLIPLFGLVWQFIVVSRISDSIRRELNNNQTAFSFEDSSVPASDSTYSSARPTYDIGMAYCVLFCCSIIPVLGGFTSIAGIICWIIYWVKLGEQKRILESHRYSY
jgi:hypothetical protein